VIIGFLCKIPAARLTLGPSVPSIVARKSSVIGSCPESGRSCASSSRRHVELQSKCAGSLLDLLPNSAYLSARSPVRSAVRSENERTSLAGIREVVNKPDSTPILLQVIETLLNDKSPATTACWKTSPQPEPRTTEATNDNERAPEINNPSLTIQPGGAASYIFISRSNSAVATLRSRNRNVPDSFTSFAASSRPVIAAR
jgi:hypothetical protein